MGKQEMNTATVKQRNKHLSKVEHYMRMAFHDAAGPAFRRAAFVAALVFIGVQALELLVKSNGLIAGLSPPVLWVSPLICAVPSFIWVYRKSPLKSNSDVVFSLLANYEPLNREAFVRLQEDVRANGLRREVVEDWLFVERSALSQPAKRSVERERFLSKQL
jgi:hypothetical protein